MEKAIIQQIVAVVDDIYLDECYDEATETINKKIPEILWHLFDAYGEISPKELSTMKTSVENLAYDPSDPIDRIFREIDKLASVGEMANKTYSQQQKVDMGYIILQGTKRFSSGLGRWDDKQKSLE